MKQCSYTWWEYEKEKEKPVKKQCPEEIWTGSKEYCIFHDPSEKKDTKLFGQKLKEKLNKKDYNFKGYWFLEEADFKEWKFQKDASFDSAAFQNAVFVGATFQGTADFLEATFQGYADFDSATFQNAVFVGATFQSIARFNRATFRDVDFSWATFQNAVFVGATFRDANFERATFHKKAELMLKNNEKMDLRYTEFLFKSYITANLTKILFHRASIENVAFIDCEWPEKIYEEEHMEDEGIDLTFKELEAIYRDLKQNMQRHGDYSRAGKFYYREMEMRRKGSNSRKRRMWLELYNLLAGYGEKPERTAISALVTILAFAFIYWSISCLQYPKDVCTALEKVVSSIYFSFVTFTTLGLGDIHPVNNLGRSLVCCEAVIGAFLIALFVVVFARKMMR